MRFDKDRFYLAQQYIQVSQNLIDNMIASTNPHVVISSEPISDAEFKEKCKNSSHMVIMPTLFCLYQGIELLLKGFVYFKDEKRRGHQMEALCDDFSKLYEEETALIKLFSGFISPLKKPVCNNKEFIRDYMNRNKITSIAVFYNSLRYPDRSNDQSASPCCDYFCLMYPNNESFLPQLCGLREDVNRVLRLSAQLFRHLEDTQ